MLISLNWIRDYVDLPSGTDPRELAERLTRTTAEVEGVTRIDLRATGLVAARIQRAVVLPDTRNLHLVTLEVADGGTVQTVSAAPVLTESACVLYAPSGTVLSTIGEIGTTEVAGHQSAGMILPGSAIGIELAAQEAVFLDGSAQPGAPLPADLFNDWVIEIDNKSLTHRPDLWGHYGIAREIAAILGAAFKPLPTIPLSELAQLSQQADRDGPVVEITIADPAACRRYTGLMLEGVPMQPAPLWMQLRLGRVGLRPISGLVDLTNYIMTDLGQPMHAFDGDKVPRIEVDWAADGQHFQTLDGVQRAVGSHDLMIKCGGESIAIAGVMGGLDTEVSESTTRLLLESANFDAATIRRTATRLGLRTDASARFEKSLDPANTVLAIQRFIHLATAMYPNMVIAGRLSDAYPTPVKQVVVSVRPQHVSTTIGCEINVDRAHEILRPLGFDMQASGDRWQVTVPSFRATGDVSIEADIIEEIARYVGYDTIAPAMPNVTMRRFEVNRLHDLQQRTLKHFTTAHQFHEIHGYLWYDSAWLAQIEFDPGTCLELANPAGEGLHRFRQTLMPGMLAAVARNRFHFAEFSLIELGTVLEQDADGDGDGDRGGGCGGGGGDSARQWNHLGLVCAQRGKQYESALYAHLKGAIETWSWDRFGKRVSFLDVDPDKRRPWEHQHLIACVSMAGNVIARTGVVDLPMRRSMDDHLSSWSICWAEIRLDGLASVEPTTELLDRIPEHPRVDFDFTLLIARTVAYAEVSAKLAAFEHELLQRIRFVTSFEGKGLGQDERTLTFRVTVAANDRTLAEQDLTKFRSTFENYLKQCGYQLRK